MPTAREAARDSAAAELRQTVKAMSCALRLLTKSGRRSGARERAIVLTLRRLTRRADRLVRLLPNQSYP